MLQADSQPQCDRHPHVPVTGFCASCLRERLAGLEETTTHTNTTTTRNFIKSIFSRHTTDPNPLSSPSSSSLFPGLRRCQSFSVAGHVVVASTFLPQRRSCDVRPRNTLSSLFHLHKDEPGLQASSCNADQQPPVLPLHQQELHDNDDDEEFQDVIEEDDQKDEIVPVVIGNKAIGRLDKDKKKLMIGEEEKEKKEPAKATKQPKDLKEIAGSFWMAASLFSKKLQKWRRKQKMKRQRHSQTRTLDEMRGVQEEEEEKKKKNGFYASSDVFGGRRSCDIDTRFCLDGRKMSLDEPRVSWDEARASWDGYLFGGGRSMFSTRLPQSTVEEDTIDNVPRSDGLIPVEEDMDRFLPGGTAQTRDYYLDPSQRRRRSIDRSTNVDEIKVVPVASAAVSIGNGGSVGVPTLKRDSNSFRRRDSTDSVEDSVQNKSRKWTKAWNIWGFINRKTSSIPRTAGVGNALEGTMPLELGRWYRDIDNENRRVCRSHSGRWSSSLRYYSTTSNCGANHSGGGGYGSARKRREEEFVPSGRRYLAASPGCNNIDDEMLVRLYNNSRRRGGGSGNNNHHRYNNNINNNTTSFARSMMHLY